MTIKTSTIAGGAAAALAALVLGTATVGASPEPTRTVRADGPTVVHAPAFADTDAGVHAVTTGSGKTVVTLHLADLPAAVRGTSLGAHVHVGACGADPAASGPHYADPGAAPGTPLHDREIWLDVDVNPAGRARSTATADFVIAPGAARSVVVHAMTTDHGTGAAGARLLCIDVPFGGGGGWNPEPV